MVGAQQEEKQEGSEGREDKRRSQGEGGQDDGGGGRGEKSSEGTEGKGVLQDLRGGISFSVGRGIARNCTSTTLQKRRSIVFSFHDSSPQGGDWFPGPLCRRPVPNCRAPAQTGGAIPESGPAMTP